jgi:hypothetical protein
LAPDGRARIIDSPSSDQRGLRFRGEGPLLNAGHASDESAPREEERRMPPKLITPKEFTNATALGLFSPRGPETQAMDRAYDAYYQQAVLEHDLAAKHLKVVSLNLLEALTALLVAKGGNWELVNRDKTSKGLLREWHGWLDTQWGAELARTIAAERGALGLDVVHSRFGVVYLLGNLQVDIDWRIMLGEAITQGGAGVVATQAAATGNASTFGAANVNLGRGHVSTAAITSASMGPTKLITKAAAHPTAKTPEHGLAPRFDLPEEAQWTTSAAYPKSVAEAFPCTAELFRTAVHSYEGVADIPGLIVGGAIGGAMALATDVVKTTVETLWKALHDVVNWVKTKMFRDDEFAAKTIAGVAKPCVAIVLQQVWKQAAPFIGGGMQLVTGISQTIKAAIDKIALWWDRSQVTLTAGHFALIGQSIESQVTKGLFAGLWTALKGAADIAMNSLLPGAGSLVSMIVGGVEWLIKALCRIVEHSHIKTFLTTAQNLWSHEKDLAKKIQHAEVRDRAHYEPPQDGSTGSIAHDVKRFSDWFKKGCEASVVVPMITLNSGMCGSIYQAIELLAPMHGGGALKAIDQKTFDAGVAYFDRLKRISHEYLTSSGFMFSSHIPDLEGIVKHACMDNSRVSTGMKILTGLAT